METLTNLHGAVPRSRLAREIGERAARLAIEAGEWRVPWPGVLVPAARAVDPLALIGAATLFAGDDTVVCGRTAAWLYGCRATEPLPVHLAVPYGRKPRRYDGLVVHNGRDLSPDRAEHLDLPVLALDRVLADLLCRDHGPSAFAIYDEALGLAEDAEALRAEVRHRIGTRVDRRGARRAGLLVELAGGRPRSPAESRLQFRIVDLGFPNPVLNHPLHDATGRLLFLLDLAWPGLRIALEYDGHVAHSGRESADADADRQRELERRGYIVIRVTAADMKDITRVEQELAAAFRLRGLPVRRTPGVLEARRHRDRGWSPR
ncbi:hypothetical protein [Pseudonocardia pini]|uniref:hypothetical protein n=1 Tax=Pseudonocardia pini TaxID=2758030 RepID=UPI0015F00481|nr:hypothetical protein [Pseudonocardia pini]